MDEYVAARSLQKKARAINVPGGMSDIKHSREKLKLLVATLWMKHLTPTEKRKFIKLAESEYTFEKDEPQINRFYYYHGKYLWPICADKIERLKAKYRHL